METMYVDAATAASEELGSVFDQVDERALAFAQNNAADMVTNIEETTREELQTLIENAFEDGMTPADLADAIRNATTFSEARAELIAQTEIAMAQSAGAMDAWRESGVVNGKEWLLSNDHDLDDECSDNADAGVVGIDEDFPSGDDAPPAHPRCVCDVSAVVEE